MQNILESDASDDDEIVFHSLQAFLTVVDTPEKVFGGSRSGKSPNLPRNFDEAYQRLMKDYFSSNPTYNDNCFERQFRMSRSVFWRLHDALIGEDIFFKKSRRSKKTGIHPLQRVVASLKMISYGVSADSLDEYCGLSGTCVLQSLNAFCKVVIQKFEAVYLRQPTAADLRRIMSIYTSREMPGCIRCIDCKHWKWQNCPIAWAGMFSGKESELTVVLEAIADSELWIWHMFFGAPGSNNDINVLDTSSTISSIMREEFPPLFELDISGRKFTLPYYLADDIYPNWALFQKTIQESSDKKQKKYSPLQETLRKDVERAFGVLVKRFHILDRPASVVQPL